MRFGRGRDEALAVVMLAMLVGLGVPACYDPAFKDCAVRCGPGGQCPNGLSCKAGYCAGPGASCGPERDAGRSDSRPDLSTERARDAFPDSSRDGGAERAAKATDAMDARDSGSAATVDAAVDRPDARDDARADHVEGGATTDGGRDAGPADAAGDGPPAQPPHCPARQYLNVVQHRCVPTHDLNGDGRADLLAVNKYDMQALISTGDSFIKIQWLDGGFYGVAATPGGRGAFAADIAGTGFAAAVAFNDTFVGVMNTGGAGFGNAALNFSVWLFEGFVGTHATFIADVDGDGDADLLQVNDSDVQVALSETLNFALGANWLNGGLGAYARFFTADVDGDGMADLIAGRAASTDVFLSTGASFRPAKTWRSGTFAGSQGTFFADVDGDGRADGVRVEASGAWVSLSTGSAFAPDAPWFTGSIAGDIVSFVADADGDGRADFVSVDATGVQVSLSTGSGFAPPSTWYAGAFTGDVSTTVAPTPSASCASKSGQ